LLKFVAQR